MLISYCIPCHKRTEDLLQALPGVVTASNASPPVQILIQDYGEQPDLTPLVASYKSQLHPDNTLTVNVYRKYPYYRMAHARNLLVRASRGTYIVMSCADIIPREHFFLTLRQILADQPYTYVRSLTSGYIGMITVHRDEFIASGAYDERFRYYGKEDKDLINRLNRRGAHVGYYDLDQLIVLMRTSRQRKFMNYSPDDTAEQTNAVYRENEQRRMLIANEELNWGSTDAT